MEPHHVDLVPVEQVSGPVASASPMDGTDPDADLSNRERELLRQLHEELAKREQTEPGHEDWQQDNRQGSGYRQPVPPPGNEFNPANFRQPEFNPGEFGGPGWQHHMDSNATDQTAVNGIPPYGSTNS